MGGHFTWTGPRDLRLLSEKALALVKDEQERQDQTVERLRAVVDCLRHQIATNEPLATGEPSNLQVATLWDAKGVTAEHVYILGVCQQALPGQRRGEYPGTDAEYRDEQRRLFYVSIASQEDAGAGSHGQRTGGGGSPLGSS
jgi:superfamily I DNA/RNA helicase